MKKLNNKGFAISTIFFSILILGTLVFGTLYATTASSGTCADDQCCDPPCSFPEPEEINTCTAFVDFTCPGEFAIGSEHFCPLKIYSKSATTSGTDDVVVALAKYYVNANRDKSNIAPYGLQYKYAICEEMTAKSLTRSTTPAHMGYYSIINGNDTKLNSMIEDGTFDATAVFTQRIGRTGTYHYKLTYLGSEITLTNNPVNDLAIFYHGKLHDLDPTLNNYVVRLVNLRDLDDFDLETDPNSKFPCYMTRHVEEIDEDRIIRVRDDVDGDHGEASLWECTHNSNNNWVYSPTANIHYRGSVYFTDIIAVNYPKYTYTMAIGSSSYDLADDNSHYISRSYYSYGGDDDFYNDYYFRPVVEVTKSYYDAHKVSN